MNAKECRQQNRRLEIACNCDAALNLAHDLVRFRAYCETDPPGGYDQGMATFVAKVRREQERRERMVAYARRHGKATGSKATGSKATGSKATGSKATGSKGGRS